jgi:N-glycosylase/DNA lyase
MNREEALLKEIENLKRSPVKNLVEARIQEFQKMSSKPNSEIFKELCFCILTANFNAEKCIKIHEEIGNELLTLTKPQLTQKLRSLGYRYPNKRAHYIVEARKHKNTLKPIINSFKDENALREWLVKNIKGIGYKEASHFLRNIGFTNLAILDFHILNILTRYKIAEKPKTLTKKNYLKIEQTLKRIAEKLDITLAELDLYLWYLETKKILK